MRLEELRAPDRFEIALAFDGDGHAEELLGLLDHVKRSSAPVGDAS